MPKTQSQIIKKKKKEIQTKTKEKETKSREISREGNGRFCTSSVLT